MAPTAPWRAAARSMPTVAAAAYAALMLISVAAMLLAMAAAWLSEFAERLAVAGWTGAQALHSAYQQAQTEGPPPGRPDRTAADAPAAAMPHDRLGAT